MRKAFLFFVFAISNITLYSQNNYVLTHADSSALEGIIVEKYYVSDSTNALDMDTTGGILPAGSTTYRIYVDMRTNYYLLAVYGNSKHILTIKTTTNFFNNIFRPAVLGFNIHKDIDKNTVALDSWLTMSAASRLFAGILKEDDHDGSFLRGRPSLEKADGFTHGVFPEFKTFNLDMSFFLKTKDDSVFTTSDGAWAALGGVKGPTDDNRVLIAQLTTNGKLSFELNLEIATPDKKNAIKFVAKNPEGSELKFDGLNYNIK